MAFLAAAAAGFALAPVLARADASIPCDWQHPDCLANHWLVVWVARQLATGGSIVDNLDYYWPVGDHPWLAGNGSDGFLYLPWNVAFAWPLSANLYEWFILALNGVAAWCLVRAVGVSRPAALAAVTTACLFPMLNRELSIGHFAQVSVCWLTFFLAAWVRMLQRPSTSAVALAAFTYVLTCFFYWYYGVFAALAGALLWCFRPAGWRATFGFVGLVVTPLGPFLWWYLEQRELVPGFAEAFPNAVTQADGQLLVLPFLLHKGPVGIQGLPLSTALFALAAPFVDRDRWTAAFVAMWLLFASLMAGTLIPGGPFELFYGLHPALQRFWWPSRHVIGMELAAVVLAARTADRWLGRTPATAIVLALSIPFQLAIQRVPLHPAQTNIDVRGTFYRDLASHPAKVLLEPPLAPEAASSDAPMYFQLLHQKQLLTGHALWVKRVRPEGWDAFMSANTFLAELQRLERGQLDGTFTFQADDLDTLVKQGATLLVLNPELFPISFNELVTAYAKVCEELFGAPYARGDRIWAWDLTRWRGATSVPAPVWKWPKGVATSGPDAPFRLRRPPSSALTLTFYNAMAPAPATP